MARYAQIAKALHTRIRHGDYRVREFPSLSELAGELGVNPRTINKAVNELLDEGVLQRLSTGRIAINEALPTEARHIALLVPAYPSIHAMLAYQAILRLANARGWQVKLVNYSHWEDPTISRSLRGFDATIFVPAGEVPPAIIQQLKSSPRPVVVLDQDTSSDGIPCLRFAASMAIPSLLNILSDAGHKRVACFNSQPVDPVIRERIDHWALWCKINSVKGQLIEEHVSPFSSAIDQAYKQMSSILDQKELDATAIFCTTGAAALGVMRALYEHGLEPGKDVAVCAADDEAGRAPYFRPSLTCVRDPVWDPYLDVCLDWFAKDGGDWVGPLLVHPVQMPIFVGESTGAVTL